MNRLWLAIRLVLCLPAVWLAIAVVGWAIWVNSREPLIDIALYAVERLSH